MTCVWRSRNAVSSPNVAARIAGVIDAVAVMIIKVLRMGFGFIMDGSAAERAASGNLFGVCGNLRFQVGHEFLYVRGSERRQFHCSQDHPSGPVRGGVWQLAAGSQNQML